MKMKIAAILTAAAMIAIPSAFAGPHGGGGHHGGGPRYHHGGPRYYHGGPRGGYYYGGGPRGYYYGGYYRPGYCYGGVGLAADIVGLVDASLGVVANVVGAPWGYYSRPVYCTPPSVQYAPPVVVPAQGYCPQPVVTTAVSQPVVTPLIPTVTPGCYRVNYGSPVYTIRY